ncbi:transglutaminase-like domain-containing protein [Rubripirellula lacrimiformis]|uniref:transglutaminase-like domain-containing protein n=1 Tax=Rubripirellula lacrimiformis TaxID=1930273 RepID=UPI001FE669D4|nr:transglutaminase-like domain-containing protein [Rubripirellula lacrimiformis]
MLIPRNHLTAFSRRQWLTTAACAGVASLTAGPLAMGQANAQVPDGGASNDSGLGGGTGSDPGDTSGASSTAKERLIYQSPQTQNWKIGLILNTPVTCTNVLATFIVPMDWPEQTVTVTGRTIDNAVSGWKTRDLPGGARQVVLQMARVPGGSTVEMTFEFAIARSRILPPDLTDDLVIPSRPPRDLRVFMGNSPNIDTSHGKIRMVARDLKKEPADNDWQRVEQIYDYVRDNVEYIEGPIRNASDALKDGKGDCEDMTSLFVALCRNNGIPARMVWIPDHCYPEFYLETPDGEGIWFPCQAAGTRQFGRMDEYRPVLQKGDRFKVPESSSPLRYVSEYFRCDRKGKSDPRPKFVRDMIDV